MLVAYVLLQKEILISFLLEFSFMYLLTKMSITFQFYFKSVERGRSSLKMIKFTIQFENISPDNFLDIIYQSYIYI